MFNLDFSRLDSSMRSMFVFWLFILFGNPLLPSSFCDDFVSTGYPFTVFIMFTNFVFLSSLPIFFFF